MSPESTPLDPGELAATAESCIAAGELKVLDNELTWLLVAALHEIGVNHAAGPQYREHVAVMAAARTYCDLALHRLDRADARSTLQATQRHLETLIEEADGCYTVAQQGLLWAWLSQVYLAVGWPEQTNEAIQNAIKRLRLFYTNELNVTLGSLFYVRILLMTAADDPQSQDTARRMLRDILRKVNVLEPGKYASFVRIARLWLTVIYRRRGQWVRVAWHALRLSSYARLSDLPTDQQALAELPPFVRLTPD